MSLAVNMLSNSPNISYITNRDIFNLNLPKNHEKYDKNAGAQIQGVFGTLYDGDCWRVFWNGAF